VGETTNRASRSSCLDEPIDRTNCADTIDQYRDHGRTSGSHRVNDCSHRVNDYCDQPVGRNPADPRDSRVRRRHAKLDPGFGCRWSSLAACGRCLVLEPRRERPVKRPRVLRRWCASFHCPPRNCAGTQRVRPCTGCARPRIHELESATPCFWGATLTRTHSPQFGIPTFAPWVTSGGFFVASTPGISPPPD
jgi:hypothetical protein